MAAATLLIGSIDGCTLTAHYDDVTMQCSSVVLDNSQGLAQITCSLSAQGVSNQNVTVSKGLSSTMNFLPAATVVSVTLNGKVRLLLQGLTMTMQATPGTFA